MNSYSLARWFAAAVSAFALALPLAMAPAHADEDELKKALIGIAALAVLSQAAKKSKPKPPAATQSSRNQAEPTVNANRTCRSPQWSGSFWVEASDGLQCKPTPAVCLRERWRGDFLIRYFDSTCMKREGFRLTRSY